MQPTLGEWEELACTEGDSEWAIGQAEVSKEGMVGQGLSSGGGHWHQATSC